MSTPNTPSDEEIEKYQRKIFGAGHNPPTPQFFIEKDGVRTFFCDQGRVCGEMSVELHEKIVAQFGPSTMRKRIELGGAQ